MAEIMRKMEGSSEKMQDDSSRLHEENLQYFENKFSTVTKNNAREMIVPQSAKHFADKLNHCLDEIDAPVSVRERATILSKMLNIPKHQAWNLLEGHQVPDADLLQKIVNEFDVDMKWLSGGK